MDDIDDDDDDDDDDVNFTSLSDEEDTLTCIEEEEEEARCWSRLKGTTRRERALVEARRDDASLRCNCCVSVAIIIFRARAKQKYYNKSARVVIKMKSVCSRLV